jgi:type IV fimbrial biogenesis protein FimT
MTIRAVSVEYNPRFCHMSRPFRGFTFVELMIALAVAAILLTAGVPSFRAVILNNRMAVQVNDMLTALSVARSEAVKRGAVVTVCKSANSMSSDPSCTETGNWAQGWIVFVDADDDGTTGTKDSGEELLQAYPPLSPGTAAKGNTVAASFISFDAPGTIYGGVLGEITFCDSRGADHARAIFVAQTGHIKASTEDIDGSALSCP